MSDFFDQATILIAAGNGGNGSATFRREKFVPRGGPDGGDGGRGGHVYLIADPRINTLQDFRDQRVHRAEHGGHGSPKNMHGKQGNDRYIKVPPGTIVRATIEGETYTIDLDRPGQRLLAARGGKGGLGNVHFTTPQRQAPRIAELGEPGEERELELELKLLADVGLVGFPNAGKSTLISVISAARPKIGSYPFTTLQPNLGIAEVGDDRFVIADIPGLIEGASQGKGLGFAFLRHVERTRVILHVIDTAGTEGRDPLEDYHRINEELRLYNPGLAERLQIVALNKLDLPEAQEQLPRLQAELPVEKDRIFAISAATREGIQDLLNGLSLHLRAIPAPQRDMIDPKEPALEWPVPEVDINLFTVSKEPEGWRVHGRKIERLVAMTNFDQIESMERLQRVLEATKISEALLSAGVLDGDTVHIGKQALVWSEEWAS